MNLDIEKERMEFLNFAPAPLPGYWCERQEREFAVWCAAKARATPSPAPIQQDAWISVEDQLPAVGQVVAVYSPPTIHDWPGSINLQFDCIDENDDDASSWAGHNNHYEHWCCVAKSEGDTGPSEKAPYTHWLPIPAAPTVKARQSDTHPSATARNEKD